MKKNPLHWNNVRDELTEQFRAAGILHKCEICPRTWPLGFAHSLRRNDIDKYLARGDREGYEEKMRTVCRLCQNCHFRIDSNKRAVSEQMIEEIIAKRGFDINEF